MPVTPVKRYTGEGGKAEWDAYRFEQEMQLEQLQLGTFAEQLLFAGRNWSREVYVWYHGEVSRRVEQGEAPIERWDDLVRAFANQYVEHGDAQTALAAFFAGDAKQRSGEPLEAFLKRMVALRSRLPLTSVDGNTFVGGVLHGVAAAHRRSVNAVAEMLDQWKLQHQGACFSFDQLQRSLLDKERYNFKETGGAASASAQAAAAAGAVAALTKQVAQLQQQLHALAVEPPQLYAMSGPPRAGNNSSSSGSSSSSSADARTATRYSSIQRAKLRAGHRCFKCGETSHFFPECPNKERDMRAELDSSN